MKPDVHERACHLIDTWRVEGISASERQWLDAHTSECTACQARAQANERALQVLRSNAVNVGRSLVAVTQARVRLRAREMRENHARLRAVWVSCGLSWILGVVSAPLVWRTFQWIGLHAALPKMLWETAFALWWLLPAAAAAVPLAWMERRATRQDGYPILPR